MRQYLTLLPMLICLPGLPALAQPIIGGGTCSSSSLSGTYELLLSGRQLTSTGAVTRIFQGVGTATFDGLNKITLAMTANTVGTSQVFGTPLTYSGTYSMQSNCMGAINITTGDIASFTLEACSSGASFALIGRIVRV